MAVAGKVVARAEAAMSAVVRVEERVEGQEVGG